MGELPRILLAALSLGAGIGAAASDVIIPDIDTSVKRPIAIEDVSALREVASLSVAPDGRRYAVLVHQGNPATNQYRSGWYIGETSGGLLIPVGDGGALGLKVMPTGHVTGALDASESRWSPDGAWIAYTRRGEDGRQLWRSRADGSRQEQLTHNAGDIREFAWREDGRALLFTTAAPRDEILATARARAQQGYRFDEDLWLFSDFMLPQLIVPPTQASDVWIVTFDERAERKGGEKEQAVFARLRAPGDGAADPPAGFPDETLRLCREAAAGRIICVRENAARPAHLVAIGPGAGDMKEIADINPEFRSIRLGKIERFEWDTPEISWNAPGGALAGLYPKRAFGYIIYPPDFDPGKKYPVFIDPYLAEGFSPLGREHALHVYAANGFVVLRTEFPLYTDRLARGVSMKQLYSAELDFPHMTMLMESTLAGLDAAIARGFVDERKIGIGGVSHGSFVPLYMMQKHDRITAISISSPNWGPFQYYGPTRKAREAIAALTTLPDEDWMPKPEGEGREFLKRIDIADHIEEIEAPILMHLTAHETFAMVRLIRHLADANRPYDAYIFDEETHLKWQPAHLYNIMHRNLDWFRFWLQAYEDPDPSKADQYSHWRELRKLQCRTPRSPSDYCR